MHMQTLRATADTVPRRRSHAISAKADALRSTVSQGLHGLTPEELQARQTRQQQLQQQLAQQQAQRLQEQQRLQVRLCPPHVAPYSFLRMLVFRVLNSCILVWALHNPRIPQMRADHKHHIGLARLHCSHCALHFRDRRLRSRVRNRRKG